MTIEQEARPVKCQEYYTVAFRAAGNITLCCDRDEGHAVLHLDRRGVFWQSTRPEPPVTEEEVGAAARTLWRADDAEMDTSWASNRGFYTDTARAALEAARAVREGSRNG